MPAPLARHQGAGGEIEFQRGVQRLRRARVGCRLLPADRGDHAVDLAERQRCRGQ